MMYQKEFWSGFFVELVYKRDLRKRGAALKNFYSFLVFWHFSFHFVSSFCLFLFFFNFPSLLSSVKVVFCCCLVIKKNHRDAGLPYWRDQLYFFFIWKISNVYNSHLAEFETWNWNKQGLRSLKNELIKGEVK